MINDLMHIISHSFAYHLYALKQVLANYFSLRKGPNYSGMAVHYDVHIVSKQDVDKPRGKNELILHIIVCVYLFVYV